MRGQVRAPNTDIHTDYSSFYAFERSMITCRQMPMIDANQMTLRNTKIMRSNEIRKRDMDKHES